MSNDNQTSSHYREHTQEQDGWTVLAPPPLSSVISLPPEVPAAPLAQAVAPAATTGDKLPFDIPINSNVIGATPASRTTSYGRETPFVVAFVEICKIMGLDPAGACLGFRRDKFVWKAFAMPESTKDGLGPFSNPFLVWDFLSAEECVTLIPVLRCMLAG
ncbi:hypothetical protein C8R45DRAFT_1180719 [Mycena sanguinolenta]|nr:hypothetical protein C8R45DRAFT_1180719 [Mycena sanguinolenta]